MLRSLARRGASLGARLQQQQLQQTTTYNITAARFLCSSRAMLANEPEDVRYLGGREKKMNPNIAEDMIAKVPPIDVDGRSARCCGGGGALGHPVIFINLDPPGPQTCTYCGLRFIRKGTH